LNDFQPKSPIYYLDWNLAKRIIKDYCIFREDKAQVEFSGGEPGLHPKFKDLVLYTKQFSPFIKVNTNGVALKHRSISGVVDCWHIGALYPHRDIIKATNGQIQVVVTEKNLKVLDKIVSYYGEYGIPIKLFTK